MKSLAAHPLAAQTGGRLGARLFGAALQAVTLILLARATSPAEFGAFALGLSIGILLIAFGSFGAPVRVLRSAAAAHPEVVRATLFTAQAVTLAVVLASAALVHNCGWIGALAAVGVLAAAADQMSSYSQNEAASRGQHLAASGLVVLHRLLPAVALTVLNFSRSFSLALFAGSIGVTLLVAAIYGAGSLQRGRPERGEITRSHGFWGFSIVASAIQFEAPVLRLVSSESVVGYYSVSSRLASPLTIFVSAMSTVLIPELSKRLGSPSFRRVRTAFLAVSWLYAIALVAVSIPLADVALAWLGAEYQPARMLIIATIIGSGLSAVAQCYNAIMIARGRAGQTTLVLLVGAAVSVTSLVALDGIGGLGLLWLAPLIAHGAVVVLSYIIERRDSRVPHVGELPRPAS